MKIIVINITVSNQPSRDYCLSVNTFCNLRRDEQVGGHMAMLAASYFSDGRLNTQGLRRLGPPSGKINACASLRTKITGSKNPTLHAPRFIASARLPFVGRLLEP